MKFGRFGGFPSRSGDSPKKVESLPLEETDPTTYSALASENSLIDTKDTTDRNDFKILADGVDRYVPLTPDSNPQKQQVISRMLKGIINVADIVSIKKETGTEFYSRILPHENIQQKSDKNEVIANVMLLELVFGDYDHRFTEEFGLSDTEHLNLRVDQNVASYFDFDRANFDTIINLDNLKGEKYEVLRYLRVRLEELEARFKGEEGKAFLESIIRASGKTIAELFPYMEKDTSVEDFQDMILKRIAETRALANEPSLQKAA